MRTLLLTFALLSTGLAVEGLPSLPEGDRIIARGEGVDKKAPPGGWSFHHHDKSAKTSLIIGKAPGGERAFAIENEDSASGMFYNPKGKIAVEAGKPVVVTFSYRTEGTGAGRLTVKSGQKEVKADKLTSTDAWKEHRLEITPTEANDLVLHWTNTATGAANRFWFRNARIEPKP